MKKKKKQEREQYEAFTVHRRIIVGRSLAQWPDTARRSRVIVHWSHSSYVGRPRVEQRGRRIPITQRVVNHVVRLKFCTQKADRYCIQKNEVNNKSRLDAEQRKASRAMVRGTGKIHGQQSSSTAAILVGFRRTRKKGGGRSYGVQGAAKEGRG
jgi:hypothetical protein